MGSKGPISKQEQQQHVREDKKALEDKAKIRAMIRSLRL